jgi:peptidoglycan hydrolase-like protein with peptidoglycan-binding domain
MNRSLISSVVAVCVAGLVYADQATRSLQQTLKEQGVYYGTVTGEKSAETTAAIRRYQIRNGLHVTGELNEETLRGLNSSLNSLAATFRPNSKPAALQPDSTRLDANARLSQSSPSPAAGEPGRRLDVSPSYSASFYRSAPVRVNRGVVAGAQYQLMTRGYYRGPVDGKYGTNTASAVRAFQSSAGLPATGRLDTQTVDALGLPDRQFAYSAPGSGTEDAWIPMTKFKHRKWKVKWKSYERPWGNDEQRQANRDFSLNGYNED